MIDFFHSVSSPVCRTLAGLWTHFGPFVQGGIHFVERIRLILEENK